MKKSYLLLIIALVLVIALIAMNALKEEQRITNDKIIEITTEEEIATLTDATEEVTEVMVTEVKKMATTETEATTEIATTTEKLTEKPTTTARQTTTEHITTTEMQTTEEITTQETTEEIVSEEPTENTTEVTTEEPTTESAYTYVGTFQLTAYTATGNPCADGVYPQVGYTVACNDKRLWHKWIYIEGYGTYYCHDRGGMANNVIDIFMKDRQTCINFGRQSANVYIVN